MTVDITIVDFIKEVTIGDLIGTAVFSIVVIVIVAVAGVFVKSKVAK